MKNNLTIKHISLMAISLLFTVVCTARDPEPKASQQEQESPNTSKKVVLEYKDALHLIKDFTNLSVKPEEPIKYWAKQFIELIKHKDKQTIARLNDFLAEFHNAIKKRNALLLGMAFELNKDKFNEPHLAESIKQVIKDVGGPNAFLEILKKRLSKKANEK